VFFYLSVSLSTSIYRVEYINFYLLKTVQQKYGRPVAVGVEFTAGQFERLA